jgi:hypothetical protein
LVNLTPEMAGVYMAEYEQAVSMLPPTAAVDSTCCDCHFLRHKELVSTEGEKPRFEEYIAELEPVHVEALMKGETDVETLKAEKEFCSINASPLKPETKLFKIETVDDVARAVELGTVAEETEWATFPPMVVYLSSMQSPHRGGHH